MSRNGAKIKFCGVFIIITLIFFHSHAFGGTIYGIINPKREGIEAEVDCDGKKYKGETNRYGSYSVEVWRKGRCKIRFYYKGDWTNYHYIRSYDKPNRYDFEIDGDHNLIRR